MKKFSLILIAQIFALSLFSQTTIYLNTGGASLWNQGNAKFIVWYWNADGTTSGASDFMTLAPGETDIYKTTLTLSNSDIAGVKFLRLNASTTSFETWNDAAIWNKTDDETPGTNNCFTVTAWNDGTDGNPSIGTWSTYTEASYSMNVTAPPAAFINEAITISVTPNGYTTPTTTFTVKTSSSSTYNNCTMPYTPTETGTYSFQINVSEANGAETISETATVKVYNLPTNPITIKAQKPTEWVNDMHIYYWYENGESIIPVAMTKEGNGWYSYELKRYYGTSVNVILVNGSQWTDNSGQTSDITDITTSTCYTLSTNTEGGYTATSVDCSTVDTEGNTDPDTGGNTGDTTIDGPECAVPNQCSDVMLQGFYWDSYSATTYGTTKWADLQAQSGEISAYFDMIWLPPSANSEGGLGYHPRQWSNQSSAMGSATQLKTLIQQLHDGGTKVIADIVINHRANATSWCDFLSDNFGDYGTYQFTTKHIVRNDEMNSDSSAGDCYGAATGANDTGEQYGAARDLDHTNPYVQNAVKAYLQWLRTEMEYDGFRYDVAKGFSAGYFNIYNKAAHPEFSVGEYYDGDVNALKSWIDNTGKNSLVFDFATKFSAFNQGIASGNYAALKGSGLLGAGYSKYAVTFIDNHDTFERNDNNNDFQPISSKEKILHANAFILSMPGVPCVFYPHWYRYKEDIKPMIEARRAAGIHSESPVTDEYIANNKYECTVQGTNGYLILRIGAGSDYNNVPNGYTKVASGTNYAIMIQSNLANAIEPVMIVSPAGGKYIGGTSVEITATQDATIYYTLDGSEPTTSSTVYSAPISITTNNTVLKAFASNGTTSCAVQTNTYVTEEAPRTEPIVVKFYKPEEWTTVYMWAWDDDGNQLFPTTTGAKWPGEAITNDGNGWWSHTFDISVNSVNLLFNDGQTSGEQTGDVLAISDPICFTYAGNKTEPNAVDCGTDVNVENNYIQNSIILYPNPAKNQITITSEDNINSLKVFNIAGQCVYSSSNDNTSNVDINVSSWQSGLYLIQIKDINNNTTTAKFSKQ